MFAPRNLQRFVRRIIVPSTVAPAGTTRSFIQTTKLFAAPPSTVEGRGRRRIRLLRPIPKPIATSNDDNDDVEEDVDDDDDYDEEATPAPADDERPQYAIPTIDEATNEFSRLGLAADLVRGLAAQGFATPTPVQRAVIPRLLGGENLVMAASTGSGKTLAFALPAIQSLLSQEAAGYERQPRRPRCVILVPTRELAKQILSAIKVRAAIGYQ
jgi:hypothetical protein